MLTLRSFLVLRALATSKSNLYGGRIKFVYKNFRMSSFVSKLPSSQFTKLSAKPINRLNKLKSPSSKLAWNVSTRIATNEAIITRPPTKLRPSSSPTPTPAPLPAAAPAPPPPCCVKGRDFHLYPTIGTEERKQTLALLRSLPQRVSGTCLGLYQDMVEARKRYEEILYNSSCEIKFATRQGRDRMEGARDKERVLLLLIQEESQKSKDLEAQVAFLAQYLV